MTIYFCTKLTLWRTREDVEKKRITYSSSKKIKFQQSCDTRIVEYFKTVFLLKRLSLPTTVDVGLVSVPLLFALRVLLLTHFIRSVFLQFFTCHTFSEGISSYGARKTVCTNLFLKFTLLSSRETVKFTRRNHRLLSHHLKRNCFLQVRNDRLQRENGYA